jgi:D-alanine--poly(phosphoribitol) ligase subunit 2
VRANEVSIEEQVLAGLQAVTGAPDLAEHRDLDLYGLQILDSLRTIELVVELTARFQSEIALSEIDRSSWATPNRIIAFMQHRIGANA